MDQTQPKDIRAFKEFVLKKYPNLSTAQIKALDNFVNERETEQAVRSGVRTVDQIATKYPGLAAKLKNEGFQTKEETKASQKSPSPSAGSDLTEGQAQKQGLAKAGLRALNVVKELYEKDPSLLTKQIQPGKFQSRQFDSALFNTVNSLLRIQTGVAAPEGEIRRYMGSLGPNFGDNESDVAFKIQQLGTDLLEQGYLKPEESPDYQKIVTSYQKKNTQDFPPQSIVSPQSIGIPPPQVQPQAPVKSGNFLQDFAKSGAGKFLAPAVGGTLGTAAGATAGLAGGPIGAIAGGIAGGGAGSAAFEGGRQMLADEPNPGGAVSEGAFGAAGGLLGPFAKGLGKIATTALPENMMRGVFPQVAREATSVVSKIKEPVEKIALSKGIKGLTADRIRDKIVAHLDTLEESLQEGLQGAKGVIPFDHVEKSVLPFVNQLKAKGNQAAANFVKDRWDTIKNHFISLGGVPISTGEGIPLEQTGNFIKRGLYHETRNDWDKIATDNKQGLKVIAKAIKTGIETKFEGAKKINQELSHYGRLADSIEENLKRGRRINLQDIVRDAGAAVVGAGAGIAGGRFEAMVGALSAPIAARIATAAGPRSYAAQALSKTGQVAKKVPRINDLVNMFGQTAARVPKLFGF